MNDSNPDLTTIESQLQYCYQILQDKKGEDIVVLDLRSISSVTDYFVIVTGNSDTHLRALANSLSVGFKTLDKPFSPMHNEPSSGWIVLDGFDFMVHLFKAEERDFYHLESLWGDAKRVESVA